MGEKVTTDTGKLNGDTGEPNGTGGKRADSDSTSTASTRTRGDGGRGTGTGTGTGDGNKAEEKGLPQLVTVDTGLSDEDKKREERNAKRRERYAKQKAESGQSVKPRKVNQNKKQNEQSTVNREQINALIISLSAIVASRPNCEQWLLSDSEVDAITKPLMNIIAESEKLEVITQNSNQIALAVACISVFAPRLMVTVQKAKAEKEKKENVRKVEQAKRDTEKLNQQRDGRTADNGKGSGDVVPFYGIPIS